MVARVQTLNEARAQFESESDDSTRIDELAALDDIEYDRGRERAAKEMKIRVTTLDAKRKARQEEILKQEEIAELTAQAANRAEGAHEIVDEMNQRHALIWQAGELRVLWRHEWDGCAPRTSSVEATKLYYRKQAMRGSNPVDVWVDSERRVEFDRIAFEPENDDPRLFNLWRGWELVPRNGDCRLILAHIKNTICSGDEALYTYVVSYLADIAQNPGDPKGTAIALRGPAGAGKGAFWRYCQATFAPYVCHIISSAHFLTRFNDHLAGKLLVFIDEAAWPGDRKGLGQLKGTITERRILVERKHQPAFEIENHARYLFATNDDWAIPADFDDRRFVMLNVGGALRGNDAYWKALDFEQKSGGAAAFLDYLLHYPISINLRNAPATAALAEQKLLSLDDAGRFWRLMLTARRHRLTKGHGHDAYELTVEFGVAARTTDLYEFYLAHAQRSRVQHTASLDALGRALHRYCPSLSKREARRTDGLPDQGKRQQVYTLPALVDARTEFSTALRQTMEFDEPGDTLRW